MTPEQLIATARKYLHVRESAPNTGPEVDRFLAFVGQPPGQSWCAAYACYVVHETDPTFLLNRSASALHLLASNPDLIVTDPQPGDLVVEDHGKGLGHVSIATQVVRVDGKVQGLTTIAGNTSWDVHSRNGDRVAEHPHALPDPRVVGVIRVCQRESQTS